MKGEGTVVGLNDDGTVTYSFTGQAVGLTLEVVTEAHLPEGVDPLTSDYFSIWRLLYDRNEHDFGCTCGRVLEARHAETCGVTPLYEEMCRTFGLVSEIEKPLIEAYLFVRTNPQRVRTEEECAACLGDCPDGVCPDG